MSTPTLVASSARSPQRCRHSVSRGEQVRAQLLAGPVHTLGCNRRPGELSVGSTTCGNQRVALALAGACGAPLAAYLATGAELEDPIYSGWKVLFVTATVAVSLIGLLGGAIAIHEPGWGAALLCVSAVMVFL